jgi:hypothetical protein
MLNTMTSCRIKRTWHAGAALHQTKGSVIGDCRVGSILQQCSSHCSACTQWPAALQDMRSTLVLCLCAVPICMQLGGSVLCFPGMVCCNSTIADSAAHPVRKRASLHATSMQQNSGVMLTVFQLCCVSSCIALVLHLFRHHHASVLVLTL